MLASFLTVLLFSTAHAADTVDAYIKLYQDLGMGKVGLPGKPGLRVELSGEGYECKYDSGDFTGKLQIEGAKIVCKGVPTDVKLSLSVKYAGDSREAASYYAMHKFTCSFSDTWCGNMGTLVYDGSSEFRKED